MAVQVVHSGGGPVSVNVTTTPAISVTSPQVSVVDVNPVYTSGQPGDTGPQGPQGPAGANGADGVTVTYTLSAQNGANTDEEKIRIAGSDGNSSEVVFEAGTNLSIARDNDKITFASTVTDAVLESDTSTSGFGFVVDDDAMNNASDTKVPTQQSVKAYVDNNVTSANVTTNLATSYQTDRVTVTSSDGTDAVILEATGSQAGVMSVDMHDKLDSIASNADATTSSNVNAAGAIMHTDVAGSATGLITRAASEQYTVVAASTSSISEGSNLYYTDARADARVSAVIDTDSTLGSPSDTLVPSQAAIKTYVDSRLSPALIDNNGSVDIPTGITQAELRTAIGVDVAGTDNSTNVSLANSNYLSLNGQELTGGTVPIGSGGTGATTAPAARTALGLGDADIRSKFSAGANISISGGGVIAATGVLTSESNDLSASVTWANVPDANITSSSVTQHLSTTGSGVGGINISESNGVFSLTGSLDITADAAPVLGGNLDASGNNIVEVEEIGLRDKIYHDDDTDTYIQFNGNDSFKVVTGNIDKLSATSNKVEINPAQANVDLQVNGDTANNVLYVDASANKVGILTSSPSSALHVSGDIRVSGNVLVDGSGTVDGEDVSTLVSYNDFTGGTGIGFSSGTITVNEHTTIETAAAAPNATITVTGPSGQADSITLAAGSNITLTESQDQITIASTASGGASALDDLSDVTISGSVAGNQYLVHNGNSDFVNQALDISHDTDPDLGGDLDVGDHSIITSTGNKDITLNPDGTGRVNLGTYPIKADDSLVSGDNLKVLTYVHSATPGASEIKLVSNPQGTVTVSGTPSSTQIAAFAADTSQIAGHTGFEFDGSGFTTPNVLVEEGTLSAAGRYGSGARVTKTMFTDLNANKVAGDIYVMKTNNTNWTTRSNATTEADSSGLLAVAASTNSGAGMVLSGIVRMADNTGFASAAPGSTLYLDTVDGHATITKPTGQGKVVRIIGYVVDNGGNAGSNDGVIYFDPSNDYITLS